MRVDSKADSFYSGQYYDGMKNSLDNDLRQAKKELNQIVSKEQEKGTSDSRVSMLVAQVTGIGAKLNFYI